MSRKTGGSFSVGQTEINEGLEKLKRKFERKRDSVTGKENEITLGTASELSNLIEKITKRRIEIKNFRKQVWKHYLLFFIKTG